MGGREATAVPAGDQTSRVVSSQRRVLRCCALMLLGGFVAPSAVQRKIARRRPDNRAYGAT